MYCHLNFGIHFNKIMHVTKYVFYTLSAIIHVTKQVFYTLPAFKGGHIEVYLIRLSKSILTLECPQLTFNLDL